MSGATNGRVVDHKGRSITVGIIVADCATGRHFKIDGIGKDGRLNGKGEGQSATLNFYGYDPEQVEVQPDEPAATPGVRR